VADQFFRPKQRAVEAIWTGGRGVGVPNRRKFPGIVLGPQWISDFDPPDGQEGVAYFYDMEPLLAPTVGLSIASVGAALPAGISVQGLTTLAGTPTVNGTFAGLQMLATNAGGTQPSSVADIDLATAPQPLVLIEHGTDQGFGGQRDVVLAAPVAAGNHILVGIEVTGTLVTMTDDQAGVYTLIHEEAQAGNNGDFKFWIRTNVQDAPQTISMEYDGLNLQLTVGVYSGDLAVSQPLDTVGVNVVGTQGFPISFTGPAMPKAGGAMFGCLGSGSNRAFSAVSPASLVISPDEVLSDTQHGLLDDQVPAGAYTFEFLTAAPVEIWVAAILLEPL
jgi:hypothetical protein